MSKSVFEEAFDRRRRKKTVPKQETRPEAVPKTTKTKPKTISKTKLKPKTKPKPKPKSKPVVPVPVLSEELQKRIETLELKIRVLNDKLSTSTNETSNIKELVTQFVTERLEQIQQFQPQIKPPNLVVPSFLWMEIREALEEHPDRYKSIIGQMRSRWERPYRDVAEMTYTIIMKKLKTLNPDFFRNFD